MQDRADDTRQYDLLVLKAVDPALVKDGDELDNYRGVISTHADDTTKPTGLENDDNKSVGEVTKEGNSNSTECEGGHPEVGEEGEEGTDVKVNLTIMCKFTLTTGHRDRGKKDNGTRGQGESKQRDNVRTMSVVNVIQPGQPAWPVCSMQQVCKTTQRLVKEARTCRNMQKYDVSQIKNKHFTDLPCLIIRVFSPVVITT